MSYHNLPKAGGAERCTVPFDLMPEAGLPVPLVPLLAGLRTVSCRIEAQGARLAATLHLPVRSPQSPRAVVVLHPAVGVAQRSYQAFAAWVAADRGMACLTYDYRDFGASAQVHARAATATLTDWGILDQQAAMDHAEKLFPGVPLWHLGHSFGGAMLAHHRTRRIDRIITVATGMVHVTDHPWPYQAAARYFWFGAGPMATRLKGYLPGRAIGFGADLPAGVYWQWRRWCTRRGFFTADILGGLPAQRPEQVTAPMRVVAIADDPVVPVDTVWRMMAQFPEAVKRQQVLHPADFGLRRIGHLGAFRRENAAVWPAILGPDHR